jgi:transcriptional repressor NF-X1
MLKVCTRCFCGSTPDPKPPRLATPHSCGGPCTRVRESGCGHPCPLTCHPGPCPPCQVTTRVTCYCPRKSTIAFRCGVEQDKSKGKNLTCGNVCGRTLPCGKHTCQKVCHEETCGDCPVRESARCCCGKTEKELACGEGDAQDCSVEGETPWVGRFACDQTCDRYVISCSHASFFVAQSSYRPFDCGIHNCQKSCHPPSYKPAPCPQSPARVTHCPCGQSTIAPSLDSPSSYYNFPARTNCTSPIPTCDNTCNNIHSRCGHPCPAKCHTGPCPTCSVQVMRPCRCGSSTKTLQCHNLYNPDTGEEIEILCDRPCMALRACGRHECRRPCCPLASLAITTGGKKGKKKFMDDSTNAIGIGEERGGLHECDLVCGKLLSCGNHRCEERDHKGACPPCLQSSFDEVRD